MKKLLIIIFLLAATACWSQTFPPPPTTNTIDTAGKVFTFVEQMPEYPGGQDAMMLFLQKNIKYPKAAKKKKIEGKVHVSFVVNENGSISDITVLRDIGGGCGDEVVRVLKLMPPWKPGKQNGDVVKVKYVLPVNFQIPKN